MRESHRPSFNYTLRHRLLFMAMIERRKSKNKRIIHYAGEKISNQQSLKRERRYIQRGHIWCFKLTNRSVIDAGVGGNDARYVNHACKPNCYIHIVDGIIWIR